MATEKVSLSLDADLLEEARGRVSGSSLSAYVNEGLKRKILADRLGDLLDEWEREFGPVPDEVMRDLERQWPD